MTRTALVGGASRGLGYACAHALASNGVRVVLVARGGEDLGRAAEAVAAETGKEAIPIACDLSRSEAFEELEHEIRRRDLTIDILVNNVGGPPAGTVAEVSAADWERGLDLLFRSTLRLYALVLPGMRARRWGRLINVLSTAAVEPVSTLAISSVLRAGLAMYAKLTAWEVARDGITVNSVLPGGFRTSRAETLAADLARREGIEVETALQRAAERSPAGRLLDPGELGAAVAFLASDVASAITGTLIPVDAGQLRSV